MGRHDVNGLPSSPAGAASPSLATHVCLMALACSTRAAHCGEEAIVIDEALDTVQRRCARDSGCSCVNQLRRAIRCVHNRRWGDHARWQPRNRAACWAGTAGSWRQWAGVGPQLSAQIGLVKNLGKILYHDYLIPFELSSVLFLTAMVGAVLLGKKEQI